MQTPKIHQVFDKNGNWLGDFPTLEFAKLFMVVVEQVGKQPSRLATKHDGSVGQYDADRLGA